jgi:hypothetical protein
MARSRARSLSTAARYRIGVLLLAVVFIGGWELFVRTARWYGQQRISWHQLPLPVQQAVRERLGDVVLVELELQPATSETTYVVRIVGPDGARTRYWLAADGSDWPSPATNASQDNELQ